MFRLNEEIMKTIMEQTGLSQDEIIAFVGKKKLTFPGITEFGALIILCKELCVKNTASMIY
jgi:hypothetical protein